MLFRSLRSSNSEQDEDTQDDQQSLIKDEPVHSKKPDKSQLVQEEKAETGSVCDKFNNIHTYKRKTLMTKTLLNQPFLTDTFYLHIY